MANKINPTNITNLTEYPNSFKRQGAFPLERYSLFNTYDEAVAYASSNPIAYVGQMLVVADESSVTGYIISGTDGALVRLASTNPTGDIAADVEALKTAVGHPAGEGTEATGLFASDAALAARLAVLEGDSSVVGSVAEAKAAADHAYDVLIDHANNKDNPHNVTAAQVGLGNLTNDAQVKRSEMGVANGVATLGSDGKVPAAQLPSYVDDVLEYANKAGFPATGESGKIYVDLATNKTYRWGGTTYVEISASLAIGTTAGTAFDGAAGKEIADKVAGDFTVGSGETQTHTIKGYIDNKIANVADNLGALAQKDEVSETELASALKTKINNKADKVSSATAGHFAGLDSNGNLTDSGKKASDFATAAQGALADSAVQSISLSSGTQNGTLKLTVDGAATDNIKVTGLGSAAYTDAGDYATSAQGALADTAMQSITVLGHTLDKNTKTSLTVAEAKTALGLGSAAYENKEAFDESGAAAAVLGTGSDDSTKKTVYGAIAAVNALRGKVTDTEIDTTVRGNYNYITRVKTELTGTDKDTSDSVSITGAKKYADEAVKAEKERAIGAEGNLLTAINGHTNDSDIHVTTTDKTNWNGAVTDVATLKGEESVAGSVKAIAKSYADGKDAAIAEAKKAGTDAQSTIDAYKTANDTRVKAIEDKEATWDGKQDAITDGSATIATVLDNIVTLKAGVGQSAGAVTQGTGADIILAKVAKTGTAADVAIADIDNKITATTVEGALTELATSIANATNGAKVTCVKSNPTGVAARYTFSQGGVAIDGAVIDIPKDMVVESGSVVTNPEGQAAGTYLVLTLANATSDKIYINAGDLIEYVTSGSGDNDMVKIAVSADHKVTASITDGSITLAKLASAVQTEIGKAHTHTNKDVLDGITSEKVGGWDSAAAKAHDHTNKTVLDAITAEKVAKWDSADAAIEGAVEAGVASLDYTDTAVDFKVVTAVNQKDGVIAVTRDFLPAATAANLGAVKSTTAENGIAVAADGTMSVNSINVNKLVQTSGDELILFGGNA